MKLNEEQLKVYLEEVAEASVNILESYENINNMINLYESTEDILSDYEFGATYNQAAYYELLLACKARIISRMEVLKYVLNTLLDAYEDLTKKDEDEGCDCDCGCNGVCTNCEHYDVVSWDLLSILGLGEDDCEDSDEDDEVVFNLSFDPETVDKDSFKTIIESIYNKVYKGDKVGNDTQTGSKSEGVRESISDYINYRTAKNNNKKAGTVRKSSTAKDENTDSKKKRKKSTDTAK